MNKKHSSAFTIVELLVVIVVIGILASITIVSYRGITQKATAVTLQSDLANASKQLKIYQATYGSYPTALDSITKCPTLPTADTTLCLKASNGNTYGTYTSDGTTYSLIATNTTISYTVTDSLSPQVTPTLNPADWLVIGTQTWAKTNLNVGARIAIGSGQTNDSTIDKYCYNDTESNCDTYGALYQWGEAMQYTTTEGAQGICPAGSHIPSDNDWKILEIQLGMSQAQADTAAWRGTDQATQLKIGGTSGFNLLLAGYRYTDGSSNGLSTYNNLWSSSESGTDAWRRSFSLADATIGRHMVSKTYGFSVRCLGN